MFILWYNFKWHKLLWWCSTLAHSYLHQSLPGYCFFIYDTDNIKKAWGHVCRWRCLVFASFEDYKLLANVLHAGWITPGGQYAGLSPALCHTISPKHPPLQTPARLECKLWIDFIQMITESIPQPCFSRFFICCLAEGFFFMTVKKDLTYIFCVFWVIYNSNEDWISLITYYLFNVLFTLSLRVYLDT